MKKTEGGAVFLRTFISCLVILWAQAVYATGPTSVGGTYSSNQTWTPEGSPYIVTSDIIVTNCATLTITTSKPGGGEAPVVVKFNPGTGMRFGSGSTYQKQYGILNAQGSQSNSIIFTTNVPGQYWDGIQFRWNSSLQCSGNPLSIMKYCIIEYGGTGDATYGGPANLSLFSADVRLEHCSLRASFHDGLYVARADSNISCLGFVISCLITGNNEHGINIYTTSTGNGACFPSIERTEISFNGKYGIYCAGYNTNPLVGAGNHFLENGAYPLRILAIMRIDGDNTFAGNGQQAIEVIGRDIFENTTWHNFGIPYIVRETDVKIPDKEGKTLTLTIEPGTIIKFDPGIGLNLGGGSTYHKQWGILNAQGTKQQPIIFTSVAPDRYWDGITFTWSPSAEDSRLKYCVVESAGEHKEQYSNSHLDAAVVFNECLPSAATIQNTTIRYSKSDGIKFYGVNPDSASIRTCNFYGNALYDLIDQNNNKTIDATLNFWGTPNGAGDDVCSSAVVSSTVRYDPWLEEEFTEPFQITTAGANPKQFEPLTGHTSISFALSQSATWKLSIVNQQLETVWSNTGEGTANTVIWNGVAANGGVVSGPCFYRIEAENNTGRAAPVRGMLTLGNQTVARIDQPVSGSLFSPGATIIITGTAQPATGKYYEILYGSGENPASWTSMTGPVYRSQLNSDLATWDTTTINQPVVTVKLEVHTAGAVYTDIVRIGFFIAENQEPGGNTIAYRYDPLGRIIAALYPDGSSISYTYDRTGNRLTAEKSGRTPPTAVKISRFSATPTRNGVIIAWDTETEMGTAGFNLYRTIYRTKTGKGNHEKINSSLIPARGSPSAGAQYFYTDIPPRPGRRWLYMLEEVEHNGTTNFYGPASAVNRSLRALNGTSSAFRKNLRTNCD